MLSYTSPKKEIIKLENEEALIIQLSKLDFKSQDNLHNPSSNDTILLDKRKVLEYFNENVIINYSKNNWTNNDIDIKDFIKFLLLTPELFKLNTKGKYQIYMDFIHIYLNINLDSNYFPKYSLLNEKYKYIADIRDEYKFAFWITKLIKNHIFIKKYLKYFNISYQKYFENHKFYDISLDEFKIIIEIQENENHDNKYNDIEKMIYVNSKGYIIIYFKIGQFKDNITEYMKKFKNKLYYVILNKLICVNTEIYSDYLVYLFKIKLSELIDLTLIDLNEDKKDLIKKYPTLDLNDNKNLYNIINKIDNDDESYIEQRYLTTNKRYENYKDILNKLNKNSGPIIELFNITGIFKFQ